MAATVPAPPDRPGSGSVPPFAAPGSARPGVASNPQGLDPVLLDVLACPADHHAPLRLGSQDDPGAPSLTCTECGRVFPIRDGIPVLLLDEASSPRDGADRSPVGR